MSRGWAGALGAVTVALLGSCSSPNPAGEPAVRFAVTIPPLEAILAELTGGEPVLPLLPPGMSPHTYEPRPRDAAAAERALALFYVAPTLDGWAAGMPAPSRVAVFDWVPEPLRHGVGHTHDGHSHGDGADPHFWLDPLAVKAVLPAWADALAELDPANGGRYRANAERFGAELDALHAELTQVLAPIHDRPFALFHPSFIYFVERYGLKAVAYVEPEPGKEAAPQHLASVIETVKASGARAVFSEPQLARKPAEVVAESAGVALAELDPMGGQPGRATYADLLRYNATVLRDTLE